MSTAIMDYVQFLYEKSDVKMMNLKCVNPSVNWLTYRLKYAAFGNGITKWESPAKFLSYQIMNNRNIIEISDIRKTGVNSFKTYLTGK